MGVISNEQVYSELIKNHFFYFLTKGENFGHIISESLITGTPVIISDQTSWKNLSEAEVGWKLDLSNEGSIIKILNKTVEMNDEEYRKMVTTVIITLRLKVIYLEIFEKWKKCLNKIKLNVLQQLESYFEKVIK